jgi:CubicO group peptidase (beta-lactamase class C family)
MTRNAPRRPLANLVRSGVTIAFAALSAASTFVLSVAAQEAPRSDVEARVDAVFAEWDHTDTPGCAVGVYRDGTMVYAHGYGMADLERGVVITPRTVFDIGSTSKQFAAASILLLQQQGRLSLDDEARRYVPELPAYSRPVTIRHLLHHTSGLRDYIGLLTLAGARIDDVTTADDAIAMISRQKRLNFEPGTEHLYSNSGYFLLSIIVERVAGQSLRDFAAEQIFGPLGMERTQYLGSYDDIVTDRALAYSPRAGGLRADMSRWLQLGDGAVFTTVEDLLNWDRNFYDGRVGGDELVAALQTTDTLENGEALTYARGLVMGDYRGARTVSHGGAWGGYRAELLRFPDHRFSVATLCNLGTTNPSRLARQVAEIYLADVLDPGAMPRSPGDAVVNDDEVDVPVQALLELAGTYRDPVSRVLRTFEFDEGTLYLATSGPRYELRPRDARSFDLVGAPAAVSLAFEPGPGTPAIRLRWTIDGQRPALLERIEIVEPTAEELAHYAGTFRSDELEALFSLEPAGTGLLLHRRGAADQRFRPTTEDEFSAGAMSLRFTRGADGRITGFLLGLGRIRDLRFDRVTGS